MFAQGAVGTSLIAFGGLHWALDSAAAPVAAVLRLEPSMGPVGALPSGKLPATGLPARALCADPQRFESVDHRPDRIAKGPLDSGFN